MPEKPEKRKDENSLPPEGEGAGGDNLDFTFSLIPLLGKSSDKKRNSFSFDPEKNEDGTSSADPGGSGHVSSFTQMLKEEMHHKGGAEAEEKQDSVDDTGEKSEPGYENDESAKQAGDVKNIEDPLSPDFLSEQRSKWEKESRAKRIRKKLPLIIAGIAALAGVGAFLSTLYFMFIADEGYPKPAPVVTRKVSASPKKPEPKPVPKAKKTAKAKQAKAVPEKKQKQPVPSKTGSSPQKEKSVAGKQAPKKAVPVLPETPKTPLENLKQAVASGKKEDIAKAYMLLLEKDTRKPALQARLRKYLVKKGFEDVAENTCVRFAAKNPDSPDAAWLAAAASLKRPEKIRYLEKALELKKDFQAACGELVNIWIMERKFKKAAITCRKYLTDNPGDMEIRYLLTLSELYSGDTDAVRRYGEFLERENLSPERIALKMLPLVQRLPEPSASEKYLRLLKADTSLQSQYKIFSVKHKMLYSKASQEDFGSWYPGELRPYYIVFLLGRGEEKKVLLMPTSPEDFPDFWKVFLAWRSDGAWRQNAEKLLEKAKRKGDMLSYIIASVWLGKISPDEAMKMLRDISPDDEALFYFLMGEVYRKLKETKKAKILYSRAVKTKPNPYTDLIRYFYKTRQGK